MQRPYSDTDLMAYSAEHVAYEVRMLFEIVVVMTRQMAASPVATSTSTTTLTSLGAAFSVPNSITPPLATGPSLPIVTNNAYIESFMVHLRNLIDFLFDLNPKPTDVAAVDFCGGSGWQPTLSQSLRDARRRVHKELAHLTTDRIPGSSPEKHWDFGGLAQELRSVLHDFAAKALASRLSPQVKMAIR